MAISLAKLTILLGAGVVGSVLAQEGRTRDLFSGAFKIFVKQIKRTDDTSSSSRSKPQNEALLAQVNNLRQELQLLQYDNSPTVIMTGGSSGGLSTYGPPLVIVIVIGYGIIWWKGWKFSSLMYATTRDLNDSRTSVAKPLDHLFTAVKVTENKVSAKINDAGAKIDDSMANLSATKKEFVTITGDANIFSKKLQVVRDAALNLGSKVGNFEKKQDIDYGGVHYLCNFVVDNEAKVQPFIQGSQSTSRPALELPQTTPTPTLLHATSMPLGLLSIETPSPSIQASPSISSRIVVPQVPCTPRTLSSPPEPPTPSSSDASASMTRTFSLPPEPPTPSSSNASASTISGLFGWRPFSTRTSS
ncbi:uncharacterized protein LOC113281026 isoform X2 [Papaver somniferum]|uniref:uncharacterized protein LOC113281026 isoform X2 n=1 Tax=Papaver somniferum TaxID=3469 RepID=UPI000E6F974D|nr:uncharacterized protein LOC113281026 isoform X2 [Papaver somniferum]